MPGDPSAGLRGFGPLGIAAILAILLTGNIVVGKIAIFPLGALLVLAWVRLSRTPWRDIGYVRPESWTRSLLIGFVFGIALKLVMKTVVMPLLDADPINRPYQFLVGNTAILPLALYAMVVAGFAEETVFRGYMFERLGRLFGQGAGAKAFIVVLTSAFFGLAHYVTQGTPGVVQGTIVGLVFGSIFARTGSIWMLMCAHAAFDVTALAIIYWNLEEQVAHLVFK
jgi:hypothetical protein